MELEFNAPEPSWIETGGVTAVVRLDDLSKAHALTEALLHGGIRCIELTLTNRHAIAVISELAESYSDKVLIGAGTVLDPESARAAILAGAQFIVTPTLKPATIALCQRYRIPIICGALTPTELLTAWECGANWVKLFPASIGGPRYLREVLAPLPQLRIIPTGGVSLENAGEFIKAGAVAVAVGGNLVRAQLVAQGAWQAITETANAFVSAVAGARGQRARS
ncbi:MAG: bifunctional 4-hydroxy-2-oxoglutarate aldolase/2-dehydro-3-deoxy-phosphogluconate aldolase [Chloroflexi bacterium]|nr:bifunctional 4-hydroxy-2-oxoglutarate aldolase/2-dehydro-3-deoxy-phosphogluconate aldolase [Chloroflexota bacterium]